jgi:hypothetical protein
MKKLFLGVLFVVMFVSGCGVGSRQYVSPDGKTKENVTGIFLTLPTPAVVIASPYYHGFPTWQQWQWQHNKHRR